MPIEIEYLPEPEEIPTGPIMWLRLDTSTMDVPTLSVVLNRADIQGDNPRHRYWPIAEREATAAQLLLLNRELSRVALEVARSGSDDRVARMATLCASPVATLKAQAFPAPAVT